MGGAAIPHVDSASLTRSAAAATPASHASAGAAGTELGRTKPATQLCASPGQDERGTFDWSRLERAVAALVGQHSSLRLEIDDLRARLVEREQRIRLLEAQVLQANQRRQDTVKRIDELIAQLDQLDAQLAAAETVE